MSAANLGVHGLKAPSSSGGFRNYELPGSQSVQKIIPSHPKAIPGFDSAGRMSGLRAKSRENSYRDSIAKNEGTEKTDVEEALEELEEVSAALILKSCNFYSLILILFKIIFQNELVAG